MNPLKHIKIDGRFSVGLRDAYSVLSPRNSRIKLPTHSPIYSIGIKHGGIKKGMPDIRRRGTF